jgi:hypothetical protein
MLFVSPLPILLAFGIKKALELSGRLETVTLALLGFESKIPLPLFSL